MDNIVNGVGGKVCGGVGVILLADGDFEEEEEYRFEIGVGDVQKVDPW